MQLKSNPAIELTPKCSLRELLVALHIERWRRESS